MFLHAFVAMPFGLKDGIDFNRVYREYIKPALEQAGFEVFRADEELRAGEIRKDMFQELLLADLVVVDLSIDNANVWYELGVRHGLRKRGVVQIGCREDRLPFDVVTDRTLRYRLKDGAPDPATLEEDRAKLADFAAQTMAAWHGWKVSPVYQWVPYLEEPAWRTLAVPGSQEFWDRYDEWARRVEVARLKNRPGDILVLAEETPTWVLRLEARRMAAQALTKLGQFKLALDQFERALQIDPTDRICRQQKGVLLGRLGRREEAKEHIRGIVDDDPKDVEAWCLLGRVLKDDWVSGWRRPGLSAPQMRELAASEEAHLIEAVEPYTKAFVQDPRHFYAGINAIVLRHVHVHIGTRPENLAELDALAGGVRWSCVSALTREPKDFWARVSYAELSLLLSSTDTVVKEYKSAMAAANRDWFALDSCRQQLLLLKDLEFRPPQVAAALDLLEKEIAKVSPPWSPVRVFLFSGHMIDRAGRVPPRFPADKEAIAAKAIADQLDQLDAGAGDLGICGGACGGDTLFAEACLARGLKLQLHIQFEEPAFLKASVSFAGVSWVERYDRLKADANTSLRVMPEELGALPKSSSPYVRNNLWQLYSALSHGPEKVRLISLWDGQAGDGPGGTKHMVDTVEKYAGRSYILDPRQLWPAVDPTPE